MKKALSRVGVFLLCILCGMMVLGNVGRAAEKKSVKREISIVFDNSGSMYINDDAWCRATYAVEVFASMLNDGDTLRVFPMNKMRVKKTEYTMNKPLVLEGGSDTSVIRQFFSVEAKGDTHIETVTEAYKGIKNQKADEKWLIVLTDGAEFYKNKKKMSKSDSEKKLSEMLSKYAKDLNIMYLGIGSNPVIPEVKKSKYKYYYEKASTSDKILKSLTKMSNMIFGRDELDSTKNGMSFDVGMSKLIIFVQGKGISDIKVTDADGNSIGKPDYTYSPKYSEKGSSAPNFKIDKNLSGVIAIYSNLEKGKYKLKYSGNATDVGVYYEPNVDLTVRLTDEAGVPITAGSDMHPGKYCIEYGIVDSSGAFTESSLLGRRDFEIIYNVNGTAKAENSDNNGKISVELNAGDTIDVSAQVIYLGDYKIKKTGEELGWPAGGLSIVDWPVGELVMQVSGGKEVYELATLEEEGVYKLDFVYDGQPLAGEQLDRVSVDATLKGGNLDCEVIKEDSGIYVKLKNRGEIYETEKGDYKLAIKASYTDEHDKTMSTKGATQFAVQGEVHSLDVEFVKGDSFYQISKIDEKEPLNVKVLMDGKELTGEQLAGVKLTVDAEGLEFSPEPVADDSSFNLIVKNGDKIKSGKYKINVTASLIDETGYELKADDSKKVAYRPYPDWVPMLIRLFIIALILLIILIYMTRKVMPRTIVFRPDKPKGNTSIVFLKAKSRYMKKGKRKKLKINGRSSLHPDIGSISIEFSMEPASRRYVKSKKRKVKIKDISVVAANATDAPSISVSCGSCIYEKKLRKEPMIYLSGDVKNGTRVAFKTTALDGGVRKTVRIEGELIFR